MAIGFSPRRPDAVIGTGRVLLKQLFSWSAAAAESALERVLCLLIAAVPLLIRFPGRATVIQESEPCYSVLRRSPAALRVTVINTSNGISTVLPFFTKKLGPANSGSV